MQREVTILRGVIDRMKQDPPDIPFAGCGDSSCISTAGLGGMHTNGGCHCNERQLRWAVRYWRDVAVRRQAAIQAMLRGEYAPEQRTDSPKAGESPPETS